MMAVVPLHSDELRKTRVFFKRLIKLAHDASKEAGQLLMADVVETAVLQLFSCMMEENPLLSHFR